MYKSIYKINKIIADLQNSQTRLLHNENTACC